MLQSDTHFAWPQPGNTRRATRDGHRRITRHKSKNAPVGGLRHGHILLMPRGDLAKRRLAQRSSMVLPRSIKPPGSYARRRAAYTEVGEHRSLRNSKSGCGISGTADEASSFNTLCLEPR
jgi:hypothetical protein